MINTVALVVQWLTAEAFVDFNFKISKTLLYKWHHLSCACLSLDCFCQRAIRFFSYGWKTSSWFDFSFLACGLEFCVGRHSCRYHSKFLLDVNFSTYWQCCRVCRLMQRKELFGYGYYAHLHNSGFWDPWFYLFESSCVFKEIRSQAYSRDWR